MSEAREAFEKWANTEALKSYLSLDLIRGHDDEYTVIDTRIAYISYQAGLRRAVEICSDPIGASSFDNATGKQALDSAVSNITQELQK